MWITKQAVQTDQALATSTMSDQAAGILSMPRRGFLLSAAMVGGALLLGCAAQEKVATKEKAEPISPFLAYLSLNADGSVTVYSSQFDMGQNIYHGLATLVAEELDVPLSSIQVQGRAGNPKFYGNPMMGGAFQLTGGSSSIPGSWQRYRQAGAAARQMLLAAAAKRWQVDINKLTTSDGVISNATGQSLRYADLLADAASMTVPNDVKLKEPQQFKLIGKDQSYRLDAKAKSTGQQVFTADLQLPDMLIATILHPAKYGAKVKSIDDQQALKIPGVIKIFAIPSGVAIVAKHTWAALQARQVLQVQWDESAAEQRSSAAILAEYVKTSQAEVVSEQTKTALKRGDANKAMQQAEQVLEATYEFPYLAHAAMEPLNAVVHKVADEMHLYGGLQMPDGVQSTCAELAGLKPEQVKLHVMQTGGGFGRRAVADSDVFVEATLIAKALEFKNPIKLQWSRESDMSYGRYRPAHVHHVKVGLDKAGKISGWQHHIVGQSILKGTPFESMMKDGVDNASVEGVTDTPYQLDDMTVQVSHTVSPITVLWWRSVGHTHTAYVMETMLDEIAQANKVDPVALRLQLLPKDARQRAVLALVAEKAGWSKAPPANRYRGIAVHQSFGSFVATVVELSKASDGAIKVERCVVASDCGVVVNPDVVRAQIEGGTGFGLGAIWGEELRIVDGAAEYQNYDGYQCLRMAQMPQIEVHMLASSESPTGIGECAVPPIGPAFANALFQATGQRLRSLPYQKA